MSAEPAERIPRKRRGRLVAVLVILLVLLGVAAVAADGLARRIVQDTVASRIRDVLDLEATHPIAVTVAGDAVIPQLIANSLERIDIDVADVTLGSLHGDIFATAAGVPVSGTGPLRSATVDAVIDGASVEALAAEVTDGAAASVALDPPVLHVDTEVSVLGFPIALGLGLEPSVIDGEIAFAPTDLRLAGATIDAADLRDRFGSLVSGLLSPRRYCIAGDLPAGLTLTAVEVRASSLAVDFDVAPTILADSVMQETGSCA